MSMRDCVGLCEDEPGCVSVTHQPSSSNCWLKNQKFGADPQNMDGVNSMNLLCEGDYIFQLIPVKFIYDKLKIQA